MCRQKSHLALENAGHRSRGRACLNSCISLEKYLNCHLKTQTLTSFHSSRQISKLFLIDFEARMFAFLTQKKKNSTNPAAFFNPHTKAFSKRPCHQRSPGVNPPFLCGGPNGSSRHFLNLKFTNVIFFLKNCPNTNFQLQQGSGLDPHVLPPPPKRGKSTSFFKFGVCFFPEALWSFFFFLKICGALFFLFPQLCGVIASLKAQWSFRLV